MSVQRGDIVLVEFPYSDHTGRKVRPALVVQADLWNQRLDDTILAPITSSQRRRIGAATQYDIDMTIEQPFTWPYGLPMAAVIGVASLWCK